MVASRSKFVAVLGMVFTVLAAFLAVPGHAQGPGGMADTPWPMYQHDPQHTGRSEFVGPMHEPVRLWSMAMPELPGDGGMVIDAEGNLLISALNALQKVNPFTQQVLWQAPLRARSSSVPLIGRDRSIYWGVGNTFLSLQSDGIVRWQQPLNGNFVFNAGPTFGPDGNLYVSHDGMLSFTPGGEPRWYQSRPIGSHGSPAVGADGTLYADGCAYTAAGATRWCRPGYGSPVILDDGTVLFPDEDFDTLRAYHPSGDVAWTFQPSMALSLTTVLDGMGVAPDGTIYVPVWMPPAPSSVLFALHPNGQEKWRLPLELEPLLWNSESRIRHPVTVDREGNVFVCADNARCYGISPRGKVLWQHRFPLIDSLAVGAYLQPMLAADGLFYLYHGVGDLADNRTQVFLSAFADPTIYPILTSQVETLAYTVVPGAAAFTVTVPVQSSAAPISYTAALTPTASWLTIQQPHALTPQPLTLRVEPGVLEPGIYRTTLRLQSSERVGHDIEIPLMLNVGMKQLFLPSVGREVVTTPLLHLSNWFDEVQLAAVSAQGEDRDMLWRQPSLYQLQIQTIAYSPDGRRVALKLDRTGASQDRVLILDARSGGQLAELSAYGIAGFAWSPDGMELAYIATPTEGAAAGIYKVRYDGSQRTLLTPYPIMSVDVRWSPRGDRIAFQNGARIRVIRPDGTVLIPNIFPEYEGGWLEGWSPDGTSLFVHQEPRLWRYNLTTGERVALTDRALRGTVAPSPDGRRIAYLREGALGETDLWVMNQDGGGSVQLTSGPASDTEPVWSPDGKWIAFTRNPNRYANYPNTDIFVMRADGSGLHAATSNRGHDSHPFWQR